MLAQRIDVLRHQRRIFDAGQTDPQMVVPNESHLLQQRKRRFDNLTAATRLGGRRCSPNPNSVTGVHRGRCSVLIRPDQPIDRALRALGQRLLELLPSYAQNPLADRDVPPTFKVQGRSVWGA